MTTQDQQIFIAFVDAYFADIRDGLNLDDEGEIHDVHLEEAIAAYKDSGGPSKLSSSNLKKLYLYIKETSQ